MSARKITVKSGNEEFTLNAMEEEYIKGEGEFHSGDWCRLTGQCGMAGERRKAE